MIRRLCYLLFSPKLFERSVLRQPRIACAFFFLAALLPIITVLPFIIAMPYPWGPFTSIFAALLAACVLLLWQLQREQINHAWQYLRGNEKEFWQFNKG